MNKQEEWVFWMMGLPPENGPLPDEWTKEWQRNLDRDLNENNGGQEDPAMIEDENKQIRRMQSAMYNMAAAFTVTPTEDLLSAKAESHRAWLITKQSIMDLSIEEEAYLRRLQSAFEEKYSGKTTSNPGRVISKKLWPAEFQAVLEKRKTFEVRLADEDILVGDTLILNEYVPDYGYTGRVLTRHVCYVLPLQNVPYWTQAQIEEHGLQVIGLGASNNYVYPAGCEVPDCDQSQ